jgi:periplasmic divalent cation tolerance protein
MAAEALLALSTFPDEETARRIVRELVEARLTACGNILPKVESIYRWEGKVESAPQTLVIFKLPAASFDKFAEKLRALHPYDISEIIALDVAHGLADYLHWVAESRGRQT